jgi:hypothetical protein
MPLPAVLAYGYISIYGNGFTTSQNWGYPAAAGFRFGVIEQEAQDLYGLIGDSVLFKEAEVRCKLSYDNAVHTVVEYAKVVLTENPPT